MRLVLICLICVHLAAPAGMACTPMSAGDWGSSPARVRANFNAAQFVALATVVSLKTVRVADPAFPDFKMELERATVRVDRLFKASLRPGAKLKLRQDFSFSVILLVMMLSGKNRPSGDFRSEQEAKGKKSQSDFPLVRESESLALASASRCVGAGHARRIPHYAPRPAASIPAAQ